MVADVTYCTSFAQILRPLGLSGFNLRFKVGATICSHRPLRHNPSTGHLRFSLLRTSSPGSEPLPKRKIVLSAVHRCGLMKENYGRYVVGEAHAGRVRTTNAAYTTIVYKE